MAFQEEFQLGDHKYKYWGEVHMFNDDHPPQVGFCVSRGPQGCAPGDPRGATVMFLIDEKEEDVMQLWPVFGSERSNHTPYSLDKIQDWHLFEVTGVVHPESRDLTKEEMEALMVSLWAEYMMPWRVKMAGVALIKMMRAIQKQPEHIFWPMAKEELKSLNIPKLPPEELEKMESFKDLFQFAERLLEREDTMFRRDKAVKGMDWLWGKEGFATLVKMPQTVVIVQEMMWRWFDGMMVPFPRPKTNVMPFMMEFFAGMQEAAESGKTVHGVPVNPPFPTSNPGAFGHAMQRAIPFFPNVTGPVPKEYPWPSSKYIPDAPAYQHLRQKPISPEFQPPDGMIDGTLISFLAWMMEEGHLPKEKTAKEWIAEFKEHMAGDDPIPARLLTDSKLYEEYMGGPLKQYNGPLQWPSPFTRVPSVEEVQGNLDRVNEKLDQQRYMGWPETVPRDAQISLEVTRLETNDDFQGGPRLLGPDGKPLPPGVVGGSFQYSNFQKRPLPPAPPHMQGKDFLFRVGPEQKDGLGLDHLPPELQQTLSFRSMPITEYSELEYEPNFPPRPHFLKELEKGYWQELIKHFVSRLEHFNFQDMVDPSETLEFFIYLEDNLSPEELKNVLTLTVSWDDYLSQWMSTRHEHRSKQKMRFFPDKVYLEVPKPDDVFFTYLEEAEKQGRLPQNADVFQAYNTALTCKDQGPEWLAEYLFGSSENSEDLEAIKAWLDWLQNHNPIHDPYHAFLVYLEIAEREGRLTLPLSPKLACGFAIKEQNKGAEAVAFALFKQEHTKDDVRAVEAFLQHLQRQ